MVRIRLIRLVFCWFASLVLLGCNQASTRGPSIEEALQEAEKIRVSGNVLEASARFGSLRIAYPENIEAHLGYQIACQAIGQEQRLVSEYESLLNKKPTAQNYYLLSRLVHDPIQGEKLCREGLQSNLKYELLRLALADFLTRQKRYSDAIVEYRELLKARPSDMDVHLKYIRTMAFAGQAREALDQYASVQGDVDNWETHFLFGLALIENWKLTESLDHLHRALELSQSNHFVMRVLGRAYALAGKIDEAIQFSERALKTKPGDWIAMLQLGGLLGLAGKLENGLTLFEKARVLAPYSIRVNKSLAFAYLDLNINEKGEAALRDVVRLDPQCSIAWSMLGSRYAKKKEYSDAKECMTRAIEIDPNDHTALITLGIIALREGKTAEADAFILRAKQCPRQPIEKMAVLDLD